MDYKPDYRETEEAFLASYHQENYERPSEAVDIAVFTIKHEEAADYRKLSKKHLSILLIKRGAHPFIGYWALPGGFVRQGETLEDTAYRELKEETNVDNVYLSQLHTFSRPDRDPRGWIISNTYMALAEEELFHLQSGTDAAEAEWFHVEYTEIGSEIENTKLGKVSRKKYRLLLTHGDIVLSAIVERCSRFENRRMRKEITIIQTEGLAFDHAEMIAYAINDLRSSLNSSMLAFELLPERFTLTDLQHVYETILGEELLTANFRRKIADYVVETDERVEGAGHRPSKLYKRNCEMFL